VQRVAIFVMPPHLIQAFRGLQGKVAVFQTRKIPDRHTPILCRQSLLRREKAGYDDQFALLNARRLFLKHRNIHSKMVLCVSSCMYD